VLTQGIGTEAPHAVEASVPKFTEFKPGRDRGDSAPLTEVNSRTLPRGSCFAD
jgi:hypothetical protein